jgi:peptidyl-prolyl cis-trans isomerase B (cyclophilin B)
MRIWIMIKKFIPLLLLFTIFGGIASVSAENKKIGDINVTMKTNKGNIEIKLTPNETPVTVANFVNLINRGYYNGLTFHRVIADFMIQGGDPDGQGFGGPGYRFKDEFVSSLRHDKAGVLSMANAGPGTNGSQFFVTHLPTPHLDNRHTVFGFVTTGQDVVNKIQKGDIMETVTVTGDVDTLVSAQAEMIKEWNAVLDKTYPKK